MTATTGNKVSPAASRPTTELLTSLGLFGLALVPRALALQRFVTADEAKWVYRSAQFLRAFLAGDWAATSVNLTPAVTTTWLGALGLSAYYGLAQAALALPLPDWLASLPPFRVELDVLAASRWPVVLLTSLHVVVTYLLARRLLGRPAALTGAVLIALDPHLLSLSRILGHDAPVAVFATWAVLALLLAIERDRAGRGAAGWWLCSGACAGLAFLSKAPALFLIPFAGLIALSDAWRGRAGLRYWLQRLALWGGAAWLIFVALWPAAWVDPVGRPLAVVNNAFLSATDEEEAAEESYWEVPDLGPWYYLVHGAFKLSPAVMVGLLLLGWSLAARPSAGRPGAEDRPPGAPPPVSNPQALFWLAAFALLFAIFISLSDKRSPRYILPAFPALSLVAAAGWSGLSARLGAAGGRLAGRPGVVPGLVLLLSLATALPYAPYYFTYFNPLLGGPLTAPRLVKLGWGEGLDEAGRWLDARPDAATSRAGSYYASALAPFFAGDLADPTAAALDYLVLYRKQRQAGSPSPTFIRYFEAEGALHTVRLNGIDYAQVYAGPALQPALAAEPAFDTGILPKPIGFRPLTPYLPIGETAVIEVVWLAAAPLPTAPSRVTLRPAAALDDLDPHRHEAEEGSEPAPDVLAAGEGRLAERAPGVVVSQHRLQIPPELGRGAYALFVDGRPLGEVEARWLRLPPLDETTEIDFGQLKLRGFSIPGVDRLRPGQTLIVSLAWQAAGSTRQDLTAFVHLLDAGGRRVAGFDRRPLDGDPPTGAWHPGEIVLDRHPVSLPPDLPPGDYTLAVGLYADVAQGPLGVIERTGAESRIRPGPARLTTITVGE